MRKWVMAVFAFAAATVGLSWLFLQLLAPELGETCRGLSGPAFDGCVAQYDLAVARSSFQITAIGAAISAVATIALVITIIFTARATEAAVEASAAAKHAVELGRDSLAREFRPYMVQSKVTNFYKLDTEGTIISRYVQVNWQNVGSTPALNVRSRTSYLVTETAALPHNFGFPDRDMRDAAGMVGKEKDFGSPTNDISIEVIQAVIDGTKFLHVWSWVEYEGFDTDTRFRSEYYTTVGYYRAGMHAAANDEDLQMSTGCHDVFNGCDDTCMFPPRTPAARRLSRRPKAEKSARA